jgi:hypothetical protein
MLPVPVPVPGVSTELAKGRLLLQECLQHCNLKTTI